VVDRFLSSVGKYKSWVGKGGGSSHIPIILYASKIEDKPLPTYKFNLICL
jgi:hypothetical protein